ncbi:MAG TPA: hypothetical protein VME46_07085, partial [Acidimicrobiales bacterium]|nr:hypothetical protein [Acidimicrobiales bacterium]
ISPNPPNGLLYTMTGTDTSGSSAPDWPGVIGDTVSDGGITWTCQEPADLAPVGQFQGYCSTSFWSAYILIFSPTPSTWTDIANPPTYTSDPAVYEINAIASLVSSFNAAYATCCGFFVPGSGARASFGWPNGRTFYGDAGTTAPSGSGVSPWCQLWIPHASFPTGSLVTPTTPNGYFYKATSGGTSDYAEPSWPTPTGTVTDGSVTWTCEGPTNAFTYGITPAATVFQFQQSQND